MVETDSTVRTERETPSPPAPPEGYDEPKLFEYPTLMLLLVSIPLFLFTAYGFGWLLWQIQGPEVFATLFSVTETEDSTVVVLDMIDVGLPLVVALFVTVVVHELIHGTVMHYYGQDVTYGVNPAMGAFYAAAFGQFQRREQLFPIGLAPLVSIAVVATPFLAVPVSSIAVTAYMVVVINTTGAVGDLYVVWRLRRMPEGTLLYDVDLRHMYVFEPLDVGA
ncbi:DUF3267 domain-containing protein [Natrinema sp. DC36]|uniref:DUF3267 domain-containing protein n=1 Tax=Natrinema sp. DC36 TaxID=2878680 RepID=UPI001CEFC44A|nr:DUF3267 domain-containing protein [Natrinema sp. DC36]